MNSMESQKPILLISAQPDAKRAEMNLTRTCELDWFRSTLNLNQDSTRIKLISAADDVLPTECCYSGVIIGGSAHSVYENSDWIQELKQFIQKIHHLDIPLLGICFGAQLIAESFGGQIKKGKKLEAGLIEVQLSPAGIQDPLFKDVERTFDIYSYHGDEIFHLPDHTDIQILASNQDYSVQAFRIGLHTRGVQFHPEIGRRRIEEALSQRRQSLIDGRLFTEDEFQQLISDLDRKEFERARRQILKNFDQYFVQTSKSLYD
ncbi:type 1 glutamine amidotransferase [Candidatus Uhrbacteria bacterium]|nr:type 1 glutamine amidotransferase [Candidatus Uhrbacteria bacterium]